MRARLDVAGVEAADLGHDLGRELVAQRQLLRRRQPRGDDGALLAREVERHQAGLLLEHQPVAGDLAAMATPARASTKAVPTLGWPANGISALGVKMRTSAVCAGSLGGSTKVVSARLNSAAIDCICSVERPAASVMTASGLPPNLRSVKTSTVTKSSFMISNLPRPAKLAA